MKRILTATLCCVIIFLQAGPCFAVGSGVQIEENADGSFFLITDTSIFENTDIDQQLKPQTPPVDESIGSTGGITPNGTASGESSANALFEIFQKIINALMRIIGQLRNQQSVTETKYIYYFSADSQLLWSGELTAEFLYSSSSVKCIDASFVFKSYDNNWKLDEYACTKSGNTASVTFAVVQKSLGVKLQTVTKTISMTCDTDGKVK